MAKRESDRVLTTGPVLSQRKRVLLNGIVQGVGFRPYIYNLAQRHQLAGFVTNTARGVQIEIEGSAAAVKDFISQLETEPPPLATITELRTDNLPPNSDLTFVILDSRKEAQASTLISPDVAICDDCLEELCDPADRRYRYSFINCTNCGPRYTIIHSIPYDRPFTSMKGFTLCPACQAEYDDPANRRFHAQPNACPRCGPSLSLPVEEVLAQIRAGEAVAIKGLGGFHLACDAGNEEAVAALRVRKDREEKPFALMVANLASARRIARLNSEAAGLLASRERPIVLLQRRGNSLAPSVAPGLTNYGVMLPYTPLQYLLFHEAAGRPPGTAWLEKAQDLVLIMTSANPGGEPLVIDEEEARRRLAAITTTICGHDREILVRVDDSVLRLKEGKPAFIRRARAYVPAPIPLKYSAAPVLALGAYLKNTVCITRGDQAFLSQHLGDMDNAATIRFFQETVDHLLTILEVEPVAVACDRHPDFTTTQAAQSFRLPVITVQHHHAHLAAVLAEHKLTGPALGLALDGFGLGDDGEAWGGELLLVEGSRFTRLGHFRPLPQPGGDAASRESWRMAAAVLHTLQRGAEIPRRFPHQPAAGALPQLLEKGVNCPLTTSCGRLFDAAAALLGLNEVQSFEGQAPMLLEGQVTTPEVMPDGWRIDAQILDFKPLLERLTEVPLREGANLFHGTLIAALTEWVTGAARGSGIETVALGGGCFLNQVLSEGLVDALRERGLKPLSARQAPPNDGGLSLGQAWVAIQTLEGAG